MQTIPARPKLFQPLNADLKDQGFFEKLCEAIAYPHTIITQGTKDKAREIMRLFGDRNSSDSQALDAVAALLSGEDWSSAYLEAVADTIRATGREIADHA